MSESDGEGDGEGLPRVLLGLQARFWYGQVDGAEWGVANGLAHGCSTSPDLLKIVFEGFHHWAAA